MRKFISLFLSVLLLLSLTVPALAQEGTQFSVHNAKDLLNLAENCRLDSYSVGLTVSLEGDIDLTGMHFFGIPIFSGTFRGNGHTVSGISITTSGSDQGFFRYLTQTAQVSDLHLSGTVAPQGSRKNVGGMVGVNAGVIQNCSFTGSVSGNRNVGGIAGTNDVSGIIENCRNDGSISGIHFTGGIVGTNAGTIRTCENAAAVNTTPQQNTVDLSQLSLETITGAESVGTATDIGGIAGTTSGTIRECKNIGAVGYPHMSYNVGGIAGSQSGYLYHCENQGAVSGRKDVGGIVGHLEPAVVLHYEEDILQILEGELKTLGKLTDRATQNAGANGQVLQGQLLFLEDQTNAAKEAIGILTSAKPQDPDTYMAAVQTLSASLSGMAQTQRAIGKAAANMASGLEKDLQAIARQSEVISEILQSEEQNVGATVQDVSDNDTQQDLTGKVEASTNRAQIQGDLNVGGIAGAMAPENDLDPEEDVDISGQLSLNAAGNLRCVILSCTNRGPVTAQKNRAGGTVGLQSMGLVRNCSNTGGVDSQEYAGGIAGQSYGRIRACYAKADIRAEIYAGGIAGSGAVVTDCRSMTMISGSECIGGILGMREENYTDEAQPITGNVYLPVDADPGAIDGISYDTQAQPMELEAFLALEKLPELFTTVSITFVFTDGTEQVLTLPTGGTVNPADIPQVPEKQGYVGHWDMLDEGNLTDICFDLVFRAAYIAHGATISGEQAQNGKPQLLLQGDFGPDTTVSLDLTVAPDWEKGLLGSTGFAISGTGQPTRGRYLLPEGADPERLQVYVRTASGKWKEVPHRVEGSYAVFDLSPGDDAVALFHAQSYLWIWILAGSVLLVLLVGGIPIAVIRKRKTASKGNRLKHP